MNENMDPRPAAERLAKLIKDQQVILFEHDAEDKEYPYIKLSIWGSIPTNELFIKLSNGEVEFVESTDSPLFFPTMGDRRFGMDVSDAEVAYRLAETVWEKRKGALVRESGKSKR